MIIDLIYIYNDYIDILMSRKVYFLAYARLNAAHFAEGIAVNRVIRKVSLRMTDSPDTINAPGGVNARARVCVCACVRVYVCNGAFMLGEQAMKAYLTRLLYGRNRPCRS